MIDQVAIPCHLGSEAVCPGLRAIDLQRKILNQLVEKLCTGHLRMDAPFF